MSADQDFDRFAPTIYNLHVLTLIVPFPPVFLGTETAFAVLLGIAAILSIAVCFYKCKWPSKKRTCYYSKRRGMYIVTSGHNLIEYGQLSDETFQG